MTAAYPVAGNRGAPWLVAGGWLSLAAAALHLACIVGGGDWYRFFGAGEDMARAAERGSITPALLTLGIAVWAAYAFSGAGRIRRLPLLRLGLVTIAAIYLARALMGFAVLVWGGPGVPRTFAAWSLGIVLVYGLTYAIGAWLAWPMLSKKEPA